MPKQPGGVSKANRLEALRKVLKRWGRLNKSKIDQYVSSALDCDAEELARSLYRDLEDLVASGELVATHFTRDGVEIGEFDPEVHKNTYCEWAPKVGGGGVFGGAELQRTGVTLLISDKLQHAISVVSVDEPPAQATHNYYFFFDNQAICLRIEKQELPLALAVGRVSGRNENGKELLGALEKTEGRRSGLLLFPTKTLSSCKGEVQLGHFVATLNRDGKLQLKDLNSKNGTWAKALSSEEALRMLLAERAGRGSTVSAWRTMSLADTTGNEGRLRTESATTFVLPVLIEASAHFKVLIF